MDFPPSPVRAPARRAFYEELFKQGEKLMECPPGTLQYLQPHLMLYRLPRQARPSQP
jgi:hypothetical protein